jgi:hypothetical protein
LIGLYSSSNPGHLDFCNVVGWSCCSSLCSWWTDNSVKQLYIKYSYVWICKWMSATGGDQLRNVLWRHRRSSQVCSCWSPQWQCNHSDDQHCKIRNIKMTSISQYIFLMCTVFLASHRQKKKVYEVYQLHHQLHHQLKEKTLFLKPPSSYKLVSFISASWWD